MFEPKTIAKKPQQKRSTTPQQAAPKRVPLPSGPLPERRPLRFVDKSEAKTTTPTTKPASTLQHAVYRPTAAPPAQGTPAAKPPASDPVRAQIGVFKDKETRQALYSAYAAIRAGQGVNPKQALEALKVFRQQTLKDRDLTAEEARTLARTLNVGFGAQAGTQGAVMDGGNPNLTGKVYQERVLAGYNALIGNKKNTVLPGVGNFFEVKTPPLTGTQALIFGNVAGAGPALAGVSGKVAAGIVGGVLKSNVPKPTQTPAANSVPLPRRGTPARPATQTGTRAQYEQARQQARLAQYRYDPRTRTDAQLQQDLKPTPRTGETVQQAQQRIQAVQRELQTRKVMGSLGERPWRPNIAANDAMYGAQGAHTLDRHGAGLSMQDMKDRVLGVGKWTQKENFSYKWTSAQVADREIQRYIAQNWDKIRRQLAETGRLDVYWDSGKKIGEGYYNKNIATGGPPTPVRGSTSWIQLRVRLDSSGDPFIMTAFPKGSFHGP